MGYTRRYFASSDNYCLVGYEKDAMLSVYIMRGSVITPHWRRVLHFADL